MIPPTPSSETQRQQAFRSLAHARQLSLNNQPDADNAYQHAELLAQQAIDESQSELETQFATQLRNVVHSDHQRHQRIADFNEFPAAIEM